MCMSCVDLRKVLDFRHGGRDLGFYKCVRKNQQGRKQMARL